MLLFPLKCEWMEQSEKEKGSCFCGGSACLFLLTNLNDLNRKNRVHGENTSFSSISLFSPAALQSMPTQQWWQSQVLLVRHRIWVHFRSSNIWFSWPKYGIIILPHLFSLIVLVGIATANCSIERKRTIMCLFSYSSLRKCLNNSVV